MGVLDEGACVAVEVDALFRIEEHVLTGIHLQDEVFQGAHTHDVGNLVALLLAHIGELTQLDGCLQGIIHHQLHQVVGIHHSTLTTLHLTVGQFHHTVREVYKFLAPLES